jgi:hypothetical protein
MIEHDLRAYLLGQPDVATLIGTRMYPMRLPQGVTMPAVTYNRIFGTSEYGHDGAAHLGRGRIQLDCWADTYEDMVNLAEACRVALTGYVGAMGDNPNVVARAVNTIDFSEPESKLWRRIVETGLWYQEA